VKRKITFAELENAHAGRKAWILGKGPTVENYKPEPGSVVIGVNDVGDLHECHYIVTTDGYKAISQAKAVRLIGVPYQVEGGVSFHVREGDLYFLHLDDLNGEMAASRLIRPFIKASRWLYCCSSSIQPAIHLAWYLGCTEVELAGVGMGGGYAKGLPTRTMNTESWYGILWYGTKRILDVLYPDKWTRN